MENWAEKLTTEIDETLAGAKDKDIRFFRVDEFKRNINRVNRFSGSCGFCNKQKIYVAKVVETIGEAIEVPGKVRRNYDRLISRLSNHMRKEHGFFPPFYYSYLFSFYGIVTGAFLGYVMSLFIPADPEAMFTIGFASCLIAGYIWGSRKDQTIRLKEKLM